MNLSNDVIASVYLVKETAAQVALRWGQDHQISADRLSHLINELRNMDLERLLR